MTLYKLDLLTNIVKEIPELEGIISSKYGNTDKDVTQALYEYNKPRNTNDTIPKTKLGIALSILDKIDTITGFFVINKEPDGNKDPYALRRHALNIIKTIIINKLHINIKTIININLNLYKNTNISLKNNIYNFIINRLENLYKNKFNTKLKINKTDIYKIFLKKEKLKKLYNYKFCNDITILKKKINKIINKNNAKQLTKNIIKKYIIKKEETILFKRLITYSLVTKILKKKKLYFELTKYILEIEKQINIFFNKIKIINNDKNITANRLCLLNKFKKYNLIINEDNI